MFPSGWTVISSAALGPASQSCWLRTLVRERDAAQGRGREGQSERKRQRGSETLPSKTAQTLNSETHFIRLSALLWIILQGNLYGSLTEHQTRYMVSRLISTIDRYNVHKKSTEKANYEGVLMPVNNLTFLRIKLHYFKQKSLKYEEKSHNIWDKDEDITCPCVSGSFEVLMTWILVTTGTFGTETK